MANTNEDDGTRKEGIVEALAALDFDGEVIQTKDTDDAWKEIVYGIEIGNPVIICVSNLQHWVTVAGKLGDKFLVFDSSNAKKNKEENGVKIFNKKDLIKKWRSRSGTYLGIVCRKHTA